MTVWTLNIPRVRRRQFGSPMSLIRGYLSLLLSKTNAVRQTSRVVGRGVERMGYHFVPSFPTTDSVSVNSNRTDPVTVLCEDVTSSFSWKVKHNIQVGLKVSTNRGSYPHQLMMVPDMTVTHKMESNGSGGVIRLYLPVLPEFPDPHHQVRTLGS